MWGKIPVSFLKQDANVFGLALCNTGGPTRAQEVKVTIAVMRRVCRQRTNITRDWSGLHNNVTLR